MRRNVRGSSYRGHPRNMDDRIRFETKEESNARREREFLALTPHERFLWFLRSFDGRRSDPDAVDQPTKNFVICKKDDLVR